MSFIGESRTRAKFYSEVMTTEIWEPKLTALIGETLIGVDLFGRLPELSLSFKSGIRVVSFTLFDGQPDWMILDRRVGKRRSFGVEKYGDVEAFRLAWQARKNGVRNANR